MRREAPDARFYSEIHDLNLEFVRLVRDHRRGTRAVFGLDSGVVEQLVRLTAVQLDAIATTPCLLATVAPIEGRDSGHSMVGEPPLEADVQWREATRVFLASLLTYVWQTARRDSLLAGLCAGRVADSAAPGRETGFPELRLLCDSRQLSLRARFHAHPRFWPDLVSAARVGDSQRIHLARMSGIQLAVAADPAAAAKTPVLPDKPQLKSAHALR